MKVFLIIKIKIQGIKKNTLGRQGKYFFDTSNIIVKDPEILSIRFDKHKRKIITPIKFFGLNKN